MALLGKVKNKDQRSTLINMLTFIASQETKSASVPLGEVEKVQKADATLLTVDLASKTENGMVTATLTEAGIKALAPAEPSVPKAPAAPVGPFAILKGITIPESKRGGAFKKSAYPFDSMEIGDMFFVANKDENDNASKRLASTVNNANKRFKDKKDGKDGQDRRFAVRVYEQNDQKGAGVWRTV